MKRKLIIVLLSLVLLAVSSYFILGACGYFDEKIVEDPEISWTKQHSTALSKELAIQEELDIKIFIEGHQDWQMERSGSGLWYEVITAGEGDSIRVGDVAEIEYVIRQLNGTVISKTESDEYEEFVVDKSEIESGIQEGIKYLKVGDKARFIIPSHLAHGLVGDLDKIPPMASLWVELKVLGKKE